VEGTRPRPVFPGAACSAYIAVRSFFDTFFNVGTSTSPKIDRSAIYDRVALNAFIGFIVGFAGGLVGLGGAELRLPYLTGTLRVPLNTAIPVNLAVSLATLIAALPTRLYTLRTTDLVPFLYQTGSLAVGAILGAYIGVNWLRGLSATGLKRAVFTLLLALGVVMITEAFIAVTPRGLLPKTGALEIISGLVLGFAIGAISGLLGVAGGVSLLWFSALALPSKLPVR
jgi:uncharacterized protein